ncbi:hypothetical protein [Hymenobacter metallicola]|uniref:DUF262 domain-containing protein n=1 Tax=Hymenobacter metallicola TaxID=2563114 RepID=A0A4Z0QGP6_9BACT|nr:hypothetical protein [Hymenobacter metallicola]TGE29238.1 hypothetical protein E5K02_07230 [Hymenobacter metallicola]
MAVVLFDKEFDSVVKSVFSSGKTTYDYAVEKFFPQIDRYYAQRKAIDEKFYKKLERDIKQGCIMPPITVALVVDDIEEIKSMNNEQITRLLSEKSDSIYILDGIQRLNTLHRAYEDGIKDFKIYFNFLISDSEDRLLYRMITLNNGQKPMSARHQIEVLAHNIFDFNDVGVGVQSEKQRSKKRVNGSFNQDDVIKGYISYLSGSINIDNQKLIESKLDELLAEKIIESSVTQEKYGFKNVITVINNLSSDEYLLKWFKQTNNMIGFCSGISKSFDAIEGEAVDDFKNNIKKFEEAFEGFDISKIKLGHLRRLTVNHFILKYAAFKEMSTLELREQLSSVSMLYV